MTNLSPAAQAVLDATGRKTWYRNDDIAAALRALAGANAYEVEGEGWYSLVIDVDDIYAIAEELENTND
jgi:hypothetical protein